MIMYYLEFVLHDRDFIRFVTKRFICSPNRILVFSTKNRTQLTNLHNTNIKHAHAYTHYDRNPMAVVGGQFL